MTGFHFSLSAALFKLKQNTRDSSQALYRTVICKVRRLGRPLSEQRPMGEGFGHEEPMRTPEVEATQTRSESTGNVGHELSELARLLEHNEGHNEINHRTSDRWSNLAARLKQEQAGGGFRLNENGRFILASNGTEADRAFVADPLVRSIQSEIKQKARELNFRTSRMSTQPGWSYRAAPIRLFADLISRSAPEVANDIGTLWALYVSLGTHVDTGSRRRRFLGGEARQMEADALRRLRDLVMITGPWIQAFPTGHALDDQGHDAGSPRAEIIGHARAFLRSTEKTRLIGDDDAVVLWATLGCGDDNISLARKARSWAVRAVSNLGIAMLLVLGGIVRLYKLYEKSAEFPAVSDLARRIENVMLQNEEGLLQLLSDLPADIWGDVRTVVQAIRLGAADNA
jgi:hypothetical protein